MASIEVPDGELTPAQLIQVVINHLAVGRVDIATAILETLRDRLEAPIEQHSA